MDIEIKIGDELREKAEHRAADAGYPSVSDWISDLVQSELSEEKQEVSRAHVMAAYRKSHDKFSSLYQRLAQ